MATVSIITINYNDAEGLRKTMRSVAEQELPPFEHIIIDGGSTDGSVEVIASEKQNFTTSVSESDKGIYDAQNKGIDRAKGDYLLFLNSGDYLASSTVLKAIDVFLGKEDLVFGDMQTTEKNGTIVQRYMHDAVNAKVLYADTIWHPVSFFKRSLFDKYGKYNLQFKIVADYEFYCRILLQYKCTYRHVPVLVSVFDTTGVSSSAERRTQLEKERYEVQQKYFNPLLLALFRFYSKLRK